MKVPRLHSWRLTPTQAVRLQNRLRRKLRQTPFPGMPRIIAGADLSFHPSGLFARGKPQTAWGCVIVYEVNSRTLKTISGTKSHKLPGLFELREIERAWAKGKLKFPYVPGLLSFREAPVLLQAFKKLHSVPDVVFFDAHGTAHPRGLGEACHLGLWLNIPSIGAAKSILVGEAKAPNRKARSWSPLKHQGKIIGAAVRTRKETKPVYVSPGHRMNLTSAIRLTLACCDRTRIPVPTREADRWSKILRKAKAS